jgi:hypothetical protein
LTADQPETTMAANPERKRNRIENRISIDLGGTPPAMSLRLLARILALSALIGASLIVAPTPTLAVAPTPTFDITVGDCWRGQVPDQYAHVHVKWQDSDGHLVDQFTTMSQEYGYWSFSDSDTTCATRPVRAGDKLTETEKDMGLYSRSFVVKALSGTFDRRTNVVSGHAPANSSLDLAVFEDDLTPYSGTETCVDVPLHASATGAYSRDTSTCMTGYNAAGGDKAWVEWLGPNGDREIVILTAPYGQAVFGTARVSGYGFAGVPVDTTLKSTGGAMRATGHTTSTATGNWTLQLKDTQGHTVAPHVGDVLTGDWAPGGTSSLKVFKMTTGFGANTVHGTCTPDTRYSFVVEWAGSTSTSTRNGTTDGAGATGDFLVEGHTLAAGDTVLFTCAKVNGDRERQVTIYP